MCVREDFQNAEQAGLPPTSPASIKQQSFEAMALKVGQRVLDLGCGPGIDTVELGRMVGESGETHGVDYDEAMIKAADAHAISCKVNAWVSHHHANATALPWATDFFDASRSEAMFQHLLDPERAFAEMLRVTKPGGALVVIDTDWATLSIDVDEVELERRLVQFHAAQMMSNPYSGRLLNRMFHRHGLVDIELGVQPIFTTDVADARQILRLDAIAHEAFAEGVLDAEERWRWQASLSRAAVTASGFFASVNAVMVSGHKPVSKPASNADLNF